MKKCAWVILAVVILGAVSPTAVRASDAGAGLLSAVLPGTGEWYNRNWRGSFPWAECVLGYVCCLVQLSSIMDAVNGNTDEGLRIDFWTAPSK